MTSKKTNSRAASAVRAPAPALKPVLDAVGKEATAREFAAALYERLSPGEIAMHSPKHWAGLAKDFQAFMATRKPGRASIRVFNPDAKKNGWSIARSVLQIVNDDMPFLVDSVTNALV